MASDLNYPPRSSAEEVGDVITGEWQVTYDYAKTGESYRLHAGSDVVVETKRDGDESL